MADATSKPISEVQLGDRVTNAGSVATTWDHPFWNETDQQWQQAAALDTGDHLVTAGGATITVDGVDGSTATWGDAYNLTVDESHTYYVTIGDSEALVHNCGGTPSGTARPEWPPHRGSTATRST